MIETIIFAVCLLFLHQQPDADPKKYKEKNGRLKNNDVKNNYLKLFSKIIGAVKNNGVMGH